MRRGAPSTSRAPLGHCKPGRSGGTPVDVESCAGALRAGGFGGAPVDVENIIAALWAGGRVDIESSTGALRNMEVCRDARRRRKLHWRAAGEIVGMPVDVENFLGVPK